MKSPHYLLFVAVAAAGVVVAATADQAKAGFLEGQQVTLDVAWPGTTNINYSYGPFFVNSTPEVTVNGVAALVDFSATVSDASVTFEFPQSNTFATDPFNGYVLTEDSTTIPAFFSASVDPGTTLAGFDQSRVSFDARDVYLNVSGLDVRAGQTLSVDFTPVPEPSTIVLLGVGAICMWTYGRCRSQANRVACR